MADKSELAVLIYEAVVNALERAGTFRVHPQKTRIAFISRMTFASVSLAQRWGDLSLILPTPLDDNRIRKLELYGPTSWGHTVRLHQPKEVGHDLEEWLSQALRRGDQETLDPGAEVQPLNQRQLAVFWTGFRGRVNHMDESLVVALPGHVADALALVDSVETKLGGVSYSADLARGAEGTYVPVDPTTGLGNGDETDVFLKVVA